MRKMENKVNGNTGEVEVDFYVGWKQCGKMKMKMKRKN